MPFIDGRDMEVQPMLNRAWTVADLVKYLEDCDPTARVVFATEYGDYHHTLQVLPVSDAVDLTSSRLTDSAYSNSKVELVRSDDVDEDDEPISDDPQKIVVLHMGEVME